MHVIYDARVMAYQYTGLGRFAGELLFKLLDTATKDKIKYTILVWQDNSTINSRNYLYEKLQKYETQGVCHISSVASRPISLCQHFYLKGYVNKLDADVYFYPHFDLPLGIKIPCVFMVHDLFPLKVPGYITKYSILKILYFKLMLKFGIRKASYVFALSKTTRKDYIQEVGVRFSHKVGVSLAGPIVNYLGKEPEKFIASKLPLNFLFYVGDRRPHKNIKRIIDLFIALKEKSNYSGCLVLAGSTKNYDFNVEEYIKDRSDVFALGQVDDELLEHCYKKMDALVFLSKYEGLGLPVLEAGRFNKRVIISDGGALPEFAPPWAYILPNSVEISTFVVDISEYLNKPFEVDPAYSDTFTWSVAAQRIKNKFIDLSKRKYEL